MLSVCLSSAEVGYILLSVIH